MWEGQHGQTVCEKTHKSQDHAAPSRENDQVPSDMCESQSTIIAKKDKGGRGSATYQRGTIVVFVGEIALAWGPGTLAVPVDGGRRLDEL